MTDTCDPVGPLASAALNDSESALGVTGHYPLDDMLASLPRADLTQDMHAAVSVNRFGLLAAAGEIAAHAGILPWPPGEATRAAATCFADWRTNRLAGDGQSEEARSLEAVRNFISAYGDSRFTTIKTPSDKTADLMDRHIGPSDSMVQRAPLQRAGYRKRDGADWLYLIDRGVWKDEVCKGLNAQEVARVLADKGHLVRGDGNNFARPERIPGVDGKVRFYTVRSSILAE